MKNNILVLGYFGYETNQLDGQTVKTRDLYNLISKKSPYTISYFDTELLKSRKMKLFCMIRLLLSSTKVVYLPAQNNLKYIFPIIFILSKIFKFEILYFVIGGWLVEFLERLPLHRRLLSKVNGVFTETKLMEQQLSEKYCFRNVQVFSNFREMTFIPSFIQSMGRLRLVFFSRINKMKGLDTIFKLAEYIFENYPNNTITIDFFGPIFSPDRNYFMERIEMYDFVQYRGVLEPEVINQTLSTYDVLLLPTHYYTEGLPGAVIDAYMSGIPVIVSSWKHASEFVDHMQTGLIIPFDNGLVKLIEYINLLFHNRSFLQRLKVAAYEKGKDFSAEEAWGKLYYILGAQKKDVTNVPCL